MLVVIAKVIVKLDKKADFLVLVQDLICATRAEEGCVSYALLENPNEAGACVFLEEWVDKAALKRHFVTPHMTQWKKRSAEFLVGKMDLTLYQGEPTTL